MGRRSKADIYDVGGEIVKLHDKEKLTHEEISQKLKVEKGLDLSREASRRAYNNTKQKAEKYVIAAESSKLILESVKDGTNTDLVEAANSILINMMYEKILAIDSIDFKDDAAMAKAMNQIVNSQVKLASFRFTFKKGVEKAKNAVYDALAKQLEKEYPELLEKLKEIIINIEVVE